MGKRDKRKKNQTAEEKEKVKAKTEKKDQKAQQKQKKKELNDAGEDDIEQILAEFQQREKTKTTVTIEANVAPTPRMAATLTPHPSADALVMFGGEFMDQRQHVYNDLFVYDIAKRTWSRVTSPSAPPPRSAHQACGVDRDGGLIYIFGGEFSSPTQSQFKHYRDLWVYQCASSSWQQIEVPKNVAADKWPAARSGHRMIIHRRKLIMFGGYTDTSKEIRYYNDLWSFDLDTGAWTLHTPALAPPARSGCVFAVDHESATAVLYGGFSSQKVKGDNEKSVTLADQWTLNLNNMTWVSRKKLGIPPSVRSGQAAAVWTAKRRLYTFGGVSDSDVGLDLVSVFHNDAHWLSIQPDDASSAPAAATSQLRWFPFELQAPTRAKGKKEHDRFRERMAARTKLDGFAEPFEVRRAKFLARKRGAHSAFDPALLSLAAVGTPMKKSKSSKQAAEESDSSDDEEEVDHVDDEDAKAMQAARAALAAPATREEEAEFAEYERVLQAEQSAPADPAVADAGASEPPTSELASVTLADEEVMDTDKVDDEPVVTNVPSARRSALAAVKGNTLFLFGGVVERKDEEATLGDFYSLDLSKPEKWELLLGAPEQWYTSFENPDDHRDDSDSEDDESDSDEDDEEEAAAVPAKAAVAAKGKTPAKKQQSDSDSEESDEDDDADSTADGDNATPAPLKGEKLADFFNRTKAHWTAIAAADGGPADDKAVRARAFALAQACLQQK